MPKISNLPESLELQALLGATLTFAVAPKNSDGSAIDMTGQTLTLTVRRQGQTAALLTLTSPSGGISAPGTSATVTITPANTATLGAGEFVYTLTRASGGVVLPLLSGPLSVRAESIYP
jgi:hypothetical protein